jgi:preprotein translocase subunit SecA
MLRKILSEWSVRELAAGLYPQRRDVHANGIDRWLGKAIGQLNLWASGFRRWRLRGFANQVVKHSQSLQSETDEQLRARIEALSGRLPFEGFGRSLLIEIFSLVREVSRRLQGKPHYPVQIMGGYALLNGDLAEMATGEGKTLTAVLPAVAAALAGFPVHIVTVNDYLARRDAESLSPIYEFFGIRVGWIETDQENDSRRAMYECGVTYCVNKDLVFDYLRDGLGAGRHVSQARLAVGRLSRAGQSASRSGNAATLLRGLCFAIVDEADSIFVDEARTPLIISKEMDDTSARDTYAQALEIARKLPKEAYVIGVAERMVRLTQVGRTQVEVACRELGDIWRFRKAREEMIQQALSALLLYVRDTHYIVTDGKVEIVDEFTGRTMPDRSWEHGLHQLIETKEALETTGQRETISRITYQRFFRRYLRLSGMTGTGAEVAPEMRAVFGINSIRIPTNRPCIRKNLGERTFVRSSDRWSTVVGRIAAVRAQGRPVLVGTRSVEASEHLGALLDAHGIEYALLNARQDADEAVIVAEAGQPGRVTVATNMAGRGTDISLHADVQAVGGLHVILTEFHESRRIDRQLFGRAGRQGDPGSCEALVSLEDDLFQSHARVLTRLLQKQAWAGARVPRMLGHLLRILAQGSAERLHANTRQRTLEGERQIDRSLAFSGRGE